MSRFRTRLMEAVRDDEGKSKSVVTACLVPDTSNGFSTITPAKFVGGCKSSVSRFGQPPIRAASTVILER